MGFDSESGEVSCEELDANSSLGPRHSCPFEGCRRKFNRPNKLEVHIRSHTGKKPFKCSYKGCDKAYSANQSLRRHVVVSHEMKSKYRMFLRCPYPDCLRELSSEESLRKHYYRNHKRKNSFTCSYCDVSFRKHTQLKQHLYHHTGVPPFRCPEPECNKGFTTLADYNRHQRGHKIHKCPDCDEEFKAWNHLRTHIKLKHPSEYVCASCGEKFSGKSRLRVHLNVHKERPEKKIFPCTYSNCPRYYFHNRNLTHHIRSSHEGKKFKCTYPDCGRELCSKKKLDYHMKLHTTKRPSPCRRKKPNRRRDAGTPKRSMAVKLSGANIPYQSEKLLLSSNEHTSEALMLEECDTYQTQKEDGVEINALSTNLSEHISKTNDNKSVSEIRDSNILDGYCDKQCPERMVCCMEEGKEPENCNSSSVLLKLSEKEGEVSHELHSNKYMSKTVSEIMPDMSQDGLIKDSSCALLVNGEMILFAIVPCTTRDINETLNTEHFEVSNMGENSDENGLDKVALLGPEYASDSLVLDKLCLYTPQVNHSPDKLLQEKILSKTNSDGQCEVKTTNNKLLSSCLFVPEQNYESCDCCRSDQTQTTPSNDILVERTEAVPEGSDPVVTMETESVVTRRIVERQRKSSIEDIEMNQLPEVSGQIDEEWKNKICDNVAPINNLQAAEHCKSVKTRPTVEKEVTQRIFKRRRSRLEDPEDLQPPGVSEQFEEKENKHLHSNNMEATENSQIRVVTHSEHHKSMRKNLTVEKRIYKRKKSKMEEAEILHSLDISGQFGNTESKDQTCDKTETTKRSPVITDCEHVGRMGTKLKVLQKISRRRKPRLKDIHCQNPPEYSEQIEGKGNKDKKRDKTETTEISQIIIGSESFGSVKIKSTVERKTIQRIPKQRKLVLEDSEDVEFQEDSQQFKDKKRKYQISDSIETIGKSDSECTESVKRKKRVEMKVLRRIPLRRKSKVDDSEDLHPQEVSLKSDKKENKGKVSHCVETAEALCADSGVSKENEQENSYMESDSISTITQMKTHISQSDGSTRKSSDFGEENGKNIKSVDIATAISNGNYKNNNHITVSKLKVCTERTRKRKKVVYYKRKNEQTLDENTSLCAPLDTVSLVDKQFEEETHNLLVAQNNVHIGEKIVSGNTEKQKLFDPSFSEITFTSQQYVNAAKSCSLKERSCESKQKYAEENAMKETVAEINNATARLHTHKLPALPNTLKKRHKSIDEIVKTLHGALENQCDKTDNEVSAITSLQNTATSNKTELNCEVINLPYKNVSKSLQLSEKSSSRHCDKTIIESIEMDSVGKEDLDSCSSPRKWIAKNDKPVANKISKALLALMGVISNSNNITANQEEIIDYSGNTLSCTSSEIIDFNMETDDKDQPEVTEENHEGYKQQKERKCENLDDTKVNLPIQKWLQVLQRTMEQLFDYEEDL